MNETPPIFSDDYQPLGISARHAVADELAGMVRDLGLTAIPGDADAKRSECGKYYAVLLSRSCVLDAEVRVYGETYFRVFWRSLLVGVPPKDSRLFGSLEETVAFLRLAFLDGDWAAASRIPTYTYKRGPRPRPEQYQPAPVQPMDEDFFCGERGGEE